MDARTVSRRIYTADQILLDYAECYSVLSSGGAGNLIAHRGGALATNCTHYDAKRSCSGSAVWHLYGGWKCSACSRPWVVTDHDLGRNEIGRRKPHRIGPPSTRLHVLLADCAVVLERVRTEMPWPYAAWATHVLAPRRDSEGNDLYDGLGVSREEVPARLRELVARGVMPEPERELTVNTVRFWITGARRYTMQLVEAKGL